MSLITSICYRSIDLQSMEALLALLFWLTHSKFHRSIHSRYDAKLLAIHGQSWLTWWLQCCVSRWGRSWAKVEAIGSQWRIGAVIPSMFESSLGDPKIHIYSQLHEKIQTVSFLFIARPAKVRWTTALDVSLRAIFCVPFGRGMACGGRTATCQPFWLLAKVYLFNLEIAEHYTSRIWGSRAVFSVGMCLFNLFDKVAHVATRSLWNDVTQSQ